jgi:hypothetical protein
LSTYDQLGTGEDAVRSEHPPALVTSYINIMRNV